MIILLWLKKRPARKRASFLREGRVELFRYTAAPVWLRLDLAGLDKGIAVRIHKEIGAVTGNRRCDPHHSFRHRIYIEYELLLLWHPKVVFEMVVAPYFQRLTGFDVDDGCH